MKLLKSYMGFVFIGVLLFTSCSEEPDTMTEDPVSENFVELSLGAMLSDFANRAALKQSLPACSSEAPAYAHIELTHNEGTALEGTIEVNVPIIEEDGAFYTDYDEDLKIPVASDGDKTASVSLTSFIVYDGDPEGDGEIIWIAPSSDSEYGNFVTQGLPYGFMVRAGSKKYIDVEVLCFDDRVVNLYGYQFFDIIPEILYEVCVFANYCNDAGRHFTANYSLDVSYLGEEGNLHTDLMPETGIYEEDYYAEPVCFAIPAPMFGEAANEDYLRITATLENWDDHYPTPEEPITVVRDLSWNDIEAHFDGESNVDYFHLFFNCGDDNGNNNGNGNGEVCDLEDPGADCDNDGIPNGQENPGCAENPDLECGEDSGNGDEGCLGEPDSSIGCETASVEGQVGNLDLPYQLMLDGAAIGTLSFEIDDGDLVVGFTMNITGSTYLLDTVELWVGDGAAVCQSLSSPEGEGELIFEGNYDGDLNIMVNANVCPASI